MTVNDSSVVSMVGGRGRISGPGIFWVQGCRRVKFSCVKFSRVKFSRVGKLGSQQTLKCFRFTLSRKYFGKSKSSVVGDEFFTGEQVYYVHSLLEEKLLKSHNASFTFG